MKKIAFAVLASLVFSTGAMAQTSPAAGAPATGAPAAADPATIAAVNELLAAMKYEEVMKSAMQAMMQQMPAQMLQGATAAINSNPKLTAEQKAAQLEKATREIPKAFEAVSRLMSDPELIKEMGAEMVPLYARHFTIDEIGQMTALYRSQLGIKMLTVMPALMAEGMQMGQKVIVPRIQKLLQDMQVK